MAKYLNYEGLQELVSKLKAYVDGEISKIDLDLFIVVTELPKQDIQTNKIYLVPDANATEQNKYDEYVYINGSWELLGSVILDTDLSNYYTKEEVNELIAKVEAGEATALDDYLKKTEAAATYATIASVPTKTSDIENDSGFITASDIESITIAEVDALFE